MATFNITSSGAPALPGQNPGSVRRSARTPSVPHPAPAAEPAPAAPAETPAAAPVPATLAEIRAAAAELEQALASAAPEPLAVHFRADERTAGFVVEIVDRDGQVVSQFPAEKLLNMRGKLAELSGMVIDEVT